MATVVWFFLGRLDRDRLKERLATICLRGASRDEIAACTARFVARVMKRGLRAGALAALEQHRSAGDRLVLLSASPDLYVPTLAERLGFHDCICTQLHWDGSRLSGHFGSANRRGEEKARLGTSHARDRARWHSRIREQRLGPAAPGAGRSSDARQRLGTNPATCRRTRDRVRRLALSPPGVSGDGFARVARNDAGDTDVQHCLKRLQKRWTCSGRAISGGSRRTTLRLYSVNATRVA